MTIRVSALLFCVFSLVACPLATLAADRGFYAGVDAGMSKFDSTRPQFGGGKTEQTVVSRIWTDDSPTTWSVNAGYRINRFLSAEVGYRDFGEGKFDQTRDLFSAG